MCTESDYGRRTAWRGRSGGSGRRASMGRGTVAGVGSTNAQRFRSTVLISTGTTPLKELPFRVNQSRRRSRNVHYTVRCRNTKLDSSLGSTVAARPKPAKYLNRLGTWLSFRGAESSVEEQEINKPLYLQIANSFIDALEKIVTSWAFGESSQTANYYVEGNYAPVAECGPEPVLSVTGHLPESLRGLVSIISPNPRFEPVEKYHWFDGDGMLHGLRIKAGGTVTYACRYVRTKRLQQEEYWGRAKFVKIGDLVGKRGLCKVIFQGLRRVLGVLHFSSGQGTANTSLVYHGGKLLALGETDMPYAIRVLDNGDFETLSRFDFDKKLNHPFTAHPKIDPVTGEMFTFGYQFLAPSNATYRVISKDGVMGDPVHISLSGLTMIHDWGITENYTIINDCPLHLGPVGMVKDDAFAIAFNRDKPIRFGLLPKYAKSQSEIRWFESANGLLLHTVNSWEEGDEVVLVACRDSNPDLQVFAIYEEEKCRAVSRQLSGQANIQPQRKRRSQTSLSGRSYNSSAQASPLVHSQTDLSHDELYPRLSPLTMASDRESVRWEYRFNLKTGQTRERILGEFHTDFPMINPDYVGRKNRYAYLGVFEDASKVIGIVKFDLTLEPELGKSQLEVGGNVAGVIWHGSGRYGSEPLYVAKNPENKNGDEDDGYLLCFIYDEGSGKSEMIVIDAKTMSPDPVAVIWLPSRVPFGFHCMFLTEEQLRSQKC